MNILFTVCGRAGSKGIKNKNIRNFLGYKLPLYTMSAIDLYIKRHPEHDYEIAASSDSMELLDIISQRIDIHRIEREEKLSGDRVAKITVINDCLCRIRRSSGKEYDMVVDLDITAPLRTVDDIERLVEKKAGSKADVVFSVVEARRNPYFNMVEKTEKGYKKVCASDFIARQQAPEIFDLNASMYAYEPIFLSSGKGVLDGYSEIIIMNDTGFLDLDREGDFELMEVIAGYLFKTQRRYDEIKEHINEMGRV